MSSAVGMILAVVMSAMGSGASEPEVGWASQYDRGVMERVIQTRLRYRHIPSDLSTFDGFVATPYCSDIGRVIYIRPEGTDRWERFLAVDCAGPDETLGWMRRNNILVEVDYNTAVRWNTVGRGIRIETMMAW